MPKLNMEEIDRYMQRQKIDPAGLRWIDPRDGVFAVDGLYWFQSEKRYHRFPRKMSRSPVRSAVKDLAACTSGGQLRFRSDSRRIVLSVKTIGNKPAPTMAEKLRPVLLKLLKKYELIDK